MRVKNRIKSSCDGGKEMSSRRPSTCCRGLQSPGGAVTATQSVGCSACAVVGEAEVKASVKTMKSVHCSLHLSFSCSSSLILHVCAERCCRSLPVPAHFLTNQHWSVHSVVHTELCCECVDSSAEHLQYNKQLCMRPKQQLQAHLKEV